MTMHEVIIRTPSELTEKEVEEIANLICSPNNPEVRIYRNGKCIREMFQHFSAAWAKRGDR
jgi:hypothetical protein